MSTEFPEVTPAPPQGNQPTNEWFTPQEREQTPDHTVGMDEPATTENKDEKPSRNFSLGKNKKPRSGVRALNKQDLDRLGNWYTGLALMLAPLNKNASMALAENTDPCVDAWAELAAQNDRVRAFLLGVLEGGAWSKLIGAHMPILYAAIPPDMWERMPGLNAFRPPVEEPADE